MRWCLEARMGGSGEVLALGLGWWMPLLIAMLLGSPGFCLAERMSADTLPLWRAASASSHQIVVNSSAKPCKVVLRDNIKGFLNWQQDWFVKAAAAQRITIEYSTRPANNADVLIFHAPTHGTRQPALASLSTSPTPMRAMVSMEQPKYSPVFADTAYLNRSMHLMVTYSLRPLYPGTVLPNLPITYYPSHIISPQAVLTPPAMAEKNGYGSGIVVATFTSNCANAGAEGRFKYLEELMKHIKVHSYGRCHHNRDEPDAPDDPNWPPIAQRRARKIQVLRRYKFYLAFENFAVDDYVSEKVFEGLVAGTLPVYRGSPSIWRFMPGNDSFIDANQISPKQLADLLQRLDRDDAQYQRYMAFKTRPLPEPFLQITNMSYVHPNVLTRICHVAHAWKAQQRAAAA